MRIRPKGFRWAAAANYKEDALFTINHRTDASHIVSTMIYCAYDWLFSAVVLYCTVWIYVYAGGSQNGG